MGEIKVQVSLEIGQLSIQKKASDKDACFI